LIVIVLDMYIWWGNCNSQHFEYAIQHSVIPHLTPFPCSRSVVIMDNASFHSNATGQLIHNVGEKVEWLSPYSPGRYSFANSIKQY